MQRRNRKRSVSNWTNHHRAGSK